MKKTIFLSLSLAVLTSFIPISKKSVEFFARPLIKTIIIDPGHGGKDVGAMGLITSEKQVALGISLKLGKAIQQQFPDIRIVYTRTTDILPGNASSTNEGIRNRAVIANEVKPHGDLFISIHCNSVGKAGGWYEKRIKGYTTKVVFTGKGRKRKKTFTRQPIYENYYVENKTAGTETFVWAADRSEEKSATIGYDSYGENVNDSLNILDLNSPEAKIRATLYAKSYFHNSYTLAKYVEDEFKKEGRIFRGGVKQRNDKGIWVLQATGMPSILIETGFITNKHEETFLNSGNGQEQVVNNIMSALKKYKAELEASKQVTVKGLKTQG